MLMPNKKQDCKNPAWIDLMERFLSDEIQIKLGKNGY